MSDKLLNLTRHIVVGYVSNNAVPAGGLPALIAGVAAAFSKIVRAGGAVNLKPDTRRQPKA